MDMYSSFLGCDRARTRGPGRTAAATFKQASLLAEEKHLQTVFLYNHDQTLFAKDVKSKELGLHRGCSMIYQASTK